MGCGPQMFPTWGDSSFLHLATKSSISCLCMSPHEGDLGGQGWESWQDAGGGLGSKETPTQGGSAAAPVRQAQSKCAQHALKAPTLSLRVNDSSSRKPPGHPTLSCLSLHGLAM